MREVVSQGREKVLVAEDSFGIKGFGIIVPDLFKLRALYVHPAYGRQGIGKVLVKNLEMLALTLGVTLLKLNSSLNAENFYRQNGYQFLSRGTFKLSTGREMECVRMDKYLVGLA
jgi:putative acetyltransferase